MMQALRFYPKHVAQSCSASALQVFHLFYAPSFGERIISAGLSLMALVERVITAIRERALLFQNSYLTRQVATLEEKNRSLESQICTLQGRVTDLQTSLQMEPYLRELICALDPNKPAELPTRLQRQIDEILASLDASLSSQAIRIRLLAIRGALPLLPPPPTEFVSIPCPAGTPQAILDLFGNLQSVRFQPGAFNG